MFYNYFNISEDEIHIISRAFGASVSHVSICWVVFIGHNTHTGHRRGTRDNVSPPPPQVYDLNDSRKLHYKIYSSNIKRQMLYLKKLNFTIKYYFAPRIIYRAVLKLSSEGKYEPLFSWSICDNIWKKYITIGLWNTGNIESMDR